MRTLTAGSFTEIEFAVKLAAGLVVGDTFALRVYRSDGTALGAYTTTPVITAA